MATVTLKVTGSVALGGKPAGSTFTVPADEKGAPLEKYWRDRLQEEKDFGGGNLKVVEAAREAPTKAEEPKTDTKRTVSTTTEKKGD